MNNHFFLLDRAFFTLLLCATALCATAQDTLSPLPPIDSLTDFQVNEYCRQAADVARNLAQMRADEAQQMAERHYNLEQIYTREKKDSTTAKEELASVKSQVSSALADKKAAAKKQKNAQKLAELAQKTAEGDSLTQRKNLPRIWNSLQKMTATEAQVSTETTATHPERRKAARKTEKTDDAEAAAGVAKSDETTANPQIPPLKTPRSPVGKYDPARDVMLNPPGLPCTWAQETKDEFSGEVFHRTQAYELFRSTPEQLKAFLKGQPNVVCEAALAGSSNQVSLLLKFTVHDPNARKSFGKLDRNSLLTLLLMDGTKYDLNNQTLSEGVQTEDNQALVFQGKYPLTPEIFKKLKRMELDRMRVAWSSGYEDYDVQYVQLLMQLGKCF